MKDAILMRSEIVPHAAVMDPWMDDGEARARFVASTSMLQNYSSFWRVTHRSYFSVKSTRFSVKKLLFMLKPRDDGLTGDGRTSHCLYDE